MMDMADLKTQVNALREPHKGMILPSATGEEVAPAFWADVAAVRAG